MIFHTSLELMKMMTMIEMATMITFSIGYTVFLHPTHLSLVPANILETLLGVAFCWSKGIKEIRTMFVFGIRSANHCMKAA